MKFRSLLLVCFISFLLPKGLSAQNLFTETIDVCGTAKFCVDCGDTKATCDPFTLDDISGRINRRYNFNKGAKGTITFQVLVDSTGFSCVMSHTDAQHSPITTELIIYLNTCIWTPARIKNKKVTASVNVLFTVANGKISGQMQRMDLSDLAPAGNPTVYNTLYPYSNPTLSSYQFTIATKYNSPLPDNNGLACVVDKSDILWYATAHGLTRYDGLRFNAVNETNSPLTATTPVPTIVVDKDNNKWMYANREIYTYNDAGWRLYDSTHMAISNTYRIVANPGGELFFTSKKGLLIVRKDRVRLIDRQVIPQLPSNDVLYAFFDSQERLWIGTTAGSIMIDKKQKITSFNGSKTPLNNVCISGIVEDGKGNLYFSANSCKDTGEDNDDEGLTVFKADGSWEHYNDKNSGIPANHLNTLLYDKFENVLWMGTHKAGLVRFDLKTGWEVYNNNNSPMPGYDINQVAEDSKGTIYAATVNGLVRVTKKQ